MSMYRVFSCVVGRVCLLWPVRSLGKTLLAFALLHSIFQVYAPTSNAEEAEVEQFYEDLQDLLELTPPPTHTHTQKCPFHYRGLECKSRKSRNTWNNRQIGLGIWNEVGQRLIEFCQENALVIANILFQQHKRRLYTWTSPDGLDSCLLYNVMNLRP